LALCYLEATACNLLRVLSPGPTGETYATGCPPQAGTEIEKISLDQVKIGDTILILHFPHNFARWTESSARLVA
jgi:hypothetical protein